MYNSSRPDSVDVYASHLLSGDSLENWIVPCCDWGCTTGKAVLSPLVGMAQMEPPEGPLALL